MFNPIVVGSKPMDPSLRYMNIRRPFIGVKSSTVLIKSESVRALLDHDKIKKIESHYGLFPPTFNTPMQHIVADTESEPVVVDRVISEQKLQLQQKSLFIMQNSYKMTKEKEFKKKLDEVALLKQQVSHQKELRKEEIIRKRKLVKDMQKEMQANLSKLKQGQALQNQTINLKKLDLDKIGYSTANDDWDYAANAEEEAHTALNESMDITLDDYYNGINLTELRKDINVGISKPSYNVKDPVGYKDAVKVKESKESRELHALAWNVNAPEIKTLASGFRVASPPSSRKSQRQGSAPAGLDSISLHSQANGSIDSSTTDYSLNVEVLARKLLSTSNSIDVTTNALSDALHTKYDSVSADYCEGTQREGENSVVLEADPVFDDCLADSQVTQQSSFITADVLEIENTAENTVIQATINPVNLTDSLDDVIHTKLMKKNKKETASDRPPVLKPVSITQADPTLYIKSSATVKRGLTQPQSKTMQGRYRAGTYTPGILELAASDPFKKPFM